MLDTAGKAAFLTVASNGEVQAQATWQYPINVESGEKMLPPSLDPGSGLVVVAGTSGNLYGLAATGGGFSDPDRFVPLGGVVWHAPLDPVAPLRAGAAPLVTADGWVYLAGPSTAAALYRLNATTGAGGPFGVPLPIGSACGPGSGDVFVGSLAWFADPSLPAAQAGAVAALTGMGCTALLNVTTQQWQWFVDPPLGVLANITIAAGPAIDSFAGTAFFTTLDGLLCCRALSTGSSVCPGWGAECTRIGFVDPGSGIAISPVSRSFHNGQVFTVDAEGFVYAVSTYTGIPLCSASSLVSSDFMPVIALDGFGRSWSVLLTLAADGTLAAVSVGDAASADDDDKADDDTYANDGVAYSVNVTSLLLERGLRTARRSAPAIGHWQRSDTGRVRMLPHAPAGLGGAGAVGRRPTGAVAKAPGVPGVPGVPAAAVAAENRMSMRAVRQHLLHSLAESESALGGASAAAAPAPGSAAQTHKHAARRQLTAVTATTGDRKPAAPLRDADPYTGSTAGIAVSSSLGAILVPLVDGTVVWIGSVPPLPADDITEQQIIIIVVSSVAICGLVLGVMYVVMRQRRMRAIASATHAPPPAAVGGQYFALGDGPSGPVHRRPHVYLQHCEDEDGLVTGGSTLGYTLGEAEGDDHLPRLQIPVPVGSLQAPHSAAMGIPFGSAHGSQGMLLPAAGDPASWIDHSKMTGNVLLIRESSLNDNSFVTPLAAREEQSFLYHRDSASYEEPVALLVPPAVQPSQPLQPTPGHGPSSVGLELDLSSARNSTTRRSMTGTK
jgi:hypothetical protein